MDFLELEFLEDWFEHIDRKLNRILAKETRTMSALTDLQTQVAKNTSVEESAVVLIQGIAKQLADAIAAGDPAALTALQVQLDKSATDLAAAITANTTPTP